MRGQATEVSVQTHRAALEANHSLAFSATLTIDLDVGVSSATELKVERASGDVYIRVTLGAIEPLMQRAANLIAEQAKR